MLARVPLADLFAVVVVFARLGTALAFLPGFSAGYVSPRMRLVFGLAISALVAPSLGAAIPAIPQSTAVLGLLLVREAAVGLFFAVLARIAMAALQTAGTVVAFLGSFANALVQDPVADQQSATIAGFFSMIGITLVFVTDLHHLMLQAAATSYGLFSPGAPLDMGDFCAAISRNVADSFSLGVQLSAPFIIINLVYNVGLGLLGRMMPQLQVFFFGLPMQIMLQIWVMMLTISGIMLVFMDYFAKVVGGGPVG
ncbi:MAG: flagellar biosynthetic protein FliR [Rhodospirillales bacterium]|nr:flagellar biosynthetic protein FliR [Rhodospirillales bacterium]